MTHPDAKPRIALVVTPKGGSIQEHGAVEVSATLQGSTGVHLATSTARTQAVPPECNLYFRRWKDGVDPYPRRMVWVGRWLRSVRRWVVNSSSQGGVR